MITEAPPRHLATLADEIQAMAAAVNISRGSSILPRGNSHTGAGQVWAEQQEHALIEQQELEQGSEHSVQDSEQSEGGLSRSSCMSDTAFDANASDKSAATAADEAAASMQLISDMAAATAAAEEAFRAAHHTFLLSPRHAGRAAAITAAAAAAAAAAESGVLAASMSESAPLDESAAGAADSAHSTCHERTAAESQGQQLVEPGSLRVLGGVPEILPEPPAPSAPPPSSTGVSACKRCSVKRLNLSALEQPAAAAAAAAAAATAAGSEGKSGAASGVKSLAQATAAAPAAAAASRAKRPQKAASTKWGSKIKASLRSLLGSGEKKQKSKNKQQKGH
jgi:hypothetical protein